MNKLPITAGMIVTSRMGRDRLKKKRRKHLNTAHIVVEELVEKLRTGAAIENHEIRSWLKREEK